MGISTIVGCSFGGLMAFGILGFLNSEPAVIIHRDESQAVRVRGTEVTVEVDAVRIRPACPGAYAIRRMKRYSPDGVLQDVAFIRERDLAGPEVGSKKYHLHLHLYTPLEGTGWVYAAELHDECSLMPALFARRPAVTSPTPVTIVQDEPDASGAAVTFDTPKATPQAYTQPRVMHDAIRSGNWKHQDSFYGDKEYEKDGPAGCFGTSCLRSASIRIP